MLSVLITFLSFGFKVDAYDSVTAKKSVKGEFQLMETIEGIELSASDIIFDNVQSSKSGRQQTIQNNTSTITVNEFTGIGTGWKLKVNLSDFNGVKPNNKLRGVRLKIPATAVTTKTEYDPTTAENLKRTMTAVEIVPSATTFSLLMEAQPLKGYGEWQAEFKKLPTGQSGEQRPMELSFNSANLADKYVAILTYSLETTPLITDI